MPATLCPANTDQPQVRRRPFLGGVGKDAAFDSDHRAAPGPIAPAGRSTPRHEGGTRPAQKAVEPRSGLGWFRGTAGTAPAFSGLSAALLSTMGSGVTN